MDNSHISQIVLPSLDLDIESDEDDDSIEPIIFHPNLQLEPPTNPTATPSVLKEEEINHSDSGIIVEDVKETKKHTYDETHLSVPADITEIELDNALIDQQYQIDSTFESHHQELANHDQELADLSNVSISESALLSKLEAVTSSLKEKDQVENNIIEEASSISAKSSSPCCNDDVMGTVVVDLRVTNCNAAINRCVAERYLSNISIGEPNDLHEIREAMKTQSLELVRLNEETECKRGEITAIDVNQRSDCSKIGKDNDECFEDVTTSIDDMSSQSMVTSVDSMLEKVNEIMYSICDPGENESLHLIKESGDVRTVYDETSDEQYDFEGGAENVNCHAQDTRQYLEDSDDVLETVISNNQEHLTMLEDRVANANFSGNLADFPSLSVDLDTNMAVISWDDVLQPGTSSSNNCSTRSPVKVSREIQVFDSLFKTSFLSAEKSVSDKSDKIDTKPKKDILNRKKPQSSQYKTTYCDQLISKKKDVNTISDNHEKSLLKKVDLFKKEIESDIAKQQLKTCQQITKDQSIGRPLQPNIEHNGNHPTSVKTTCSTGVSTDDLYLTTSAIKEEDIPPTVQNSVPGVLTKSAKKKKKKKSKGGNKETSNEDLSSHSNHELKNVLSDEDVSQVNQIANELRELTGQQVLLANNISFERQHKLIPPVQNKQFLVLKIPMESPGVCKETNSNDKMQSLIDETQCHNFNGLVVLFLFLLQSNSLKYQFSTLDVPFDVVSLFQCLIDDEMFLIVGICENDKTYLQKTKRTKLGSNFFHAVSQFINANYLEKLLGKYIPEQCLQLSCSGKLSSFINIVPDGNFLHRLVTVSPSVFINSAVKPIKLSTDSFYLDAIPSSHLKTNYVGLQILQSEPDTLKFIDVFMKLSSQTSCEVSGMKITYVPSDKDANTLDIMLAFGIQLVSTPHSGMINQSMTNITERLSLETRVSLDKLIKWFGPRFQNVKELKELANGVKTSLKCQVSKKKMKRTAETICNLSLLYNAPCYAVVLVSSLVPSWLIPFLLFTANEAGIVLKNICRNTIPAEQLCGFGIFEGNSEHFGIVRSQWKKMMRNNDEVGSFTHLLCYGSNALIKMKNICEHIADLLIKGLSASQSKETLPWLDRIPNVRSLLRRHKSEVVGKLASKDYFGVLRLNDQSVELYASYDAVSHSSVVDSFERITRHYRIPNINLAFVIVYGQELLSRLQVILEVCFLGCQSSNAPRKSLLMKSIVGIKYLRNVHRHQAREFVLDPLSSKDGKQAVNCLTSQSVVIMLLQGDDELSVRELQKSLAAYLFASNVPTDRNNMIVHSDCGYVYYLMLQHFHPNELHNELSVKYKPMSPIYLDEFHPLVNGVDRIYNSKTIESCVLKKFISPNLPEGYNYLKQKVVYELHTPSLSYPWQVLVRQEISYVGFTAKYSSGTGFAMTKAVSRIVRMGFEIVAWKFPAVRDRDYFLDIVFSRPDAMVMMRHIINEIETSFPNLQISSPSNFTENSTFINEFRRDGYGGIHDINCSTLANEIFFTRDFLFRSRDLRMLEWHPVQDGVYNFGLGFMTNTSRCKSTNDNLLEVTVVIVPRPLICGTYMGKELPRRCIFPELWQSFESISYKTLASKMTSLTKNEADDVITQLGIEPKRSNILKSYLSSTEEPFISIVLLGSCIQSNFWLDLERYFSKDEEIETLKKHLWITSSKRQVEYLVTSLFDQVLPNGKIEVRTSMV